MRKKKFTRVKETQKKRRPTSQTKIHFRIVGKRTVSDEKRRSFTHTHNAHRSHASREKKEHTKNVTN